MKKHIPAIFLFILALVANAAAQYSPVIPVGTELQVRINENLTSETAQPGDQFTASLVNSIEDENGKIIFGRGAYISGRVISAKPSGRLSDSGELVLSINNIRSGSQSANVTVGPYTVKGDSHTGSNVGKIGGGAALGAIIGGIAGGGKGAAIGAGAGTAAGTGAAAATGKKNAKVDSETVLRFVTSTDSTIVRNGSTVSPSNNQTESQSTNDVELRRRDSSTTLASNQAAPAYTSDSSSSASTVSSAPAPTSCAVCASNSANVSAFTARDRRVINGCLAENPDALASSQQNSGGQSTLQKNGTLPLTVQRRAKALPLACERQLPTLSNDLERVIYNRQVMLIDSNNRVLDIFQLAQ
jgi:hypothetical protein